MLYNIKSDARYILQILKNQTHILGNIGNRISMHMLNE